MYFLCFYNSFLYIAFTYRCLEKNVLFAGLTTGHRAKAIQFYSLEWLLEQALRNQLI